MSIKIITKSIIILISICFYSCKDSAGIASKSTTEGPTNKTATPIKKQNKEIKILPKYWPTISNNMDVTPKELRDMVTINKNYQRQVKIHKTNKTWAGVKNADNRKKAVQSKEENIKNLLGATRYNRYKSIQAKWRSK